MKKGLKILSTSLFLSTLIFSGCSCSKETPKNVSKMDERDDQFLSGLTDNSGNNLDSIYKALIANDAGNKAVANKLLDFVASEVLELDTNNVWKTRYDDLVKEKLKELTNSGLYLVDGEFSESYMVETLKANGYNITCPANVVYGDADNLACDYTDYVNRVYRVDILTTLLKQKYILDVSMKDRKNLLTNKDIRDVEYFTVSSSLDNTYDDFEIREFMRSMRDKIANGEVVSFSDAETELKNKLKDIVNEEYAKIGTSKDSSKSIEADYTSSHTQSKETGYNNKIKTIDDSKYAFDSVISDDSADDAIISEDITEILLSITDVEDSKFSRNLYALEVGDETYYYLVSTSAGQTISASDILISSTSDSSTYNYSFVRFRIINSDTTDEADIYKAVQELAKDSTLANNALSHYLEERKDVISVYDDDVYTYLKNLYPEIFTD